MVLAPHRPGRDAARIEDGVQIETLWLVTAPIDQVLFPAFLWIDGTALVPGLVWLPLVLAAALIMGSSPLMHERRTALVLASGVVATILVLWLGQAYIVPRYLSYLLVPLLVVLATGMACDLRTSLLAPGDRADGREHRRSRTARSRVRRPYAEVVREPREAYKDAAAVIEREGPVTVLAYVRNPEVSSTTWSDPFATCEQSTSRRIGLQSSQAVAYVMQPFALASVDIPCLPAPVCGTSVSSSTRGDEMNVWLVPRALRAGERQQVEAVLDSSLVVRDAIERELGTIDVRRRRSPDRAATARSATRGASTGARRGRGATACEHAPRAPDDGIDRLGRENSVDRDVREGRLEDLRELSRRVLAW